MGGANFLETASRLKLMEEFFTLPLLSRSGFSHFFGTKTFTQAKAKAFHNGRSARLIQVHGDGIIKISHAETEEMSTGDALMTDCPGVLITIFTADCLPVIIIDPNHHAVAIAHAGWRGSLLRIVEKTVFAMAKDFGSNPDALLVGLGHRIGQCCFEVGREVWQQVEKEPCFSSGVITRKEGEKAWVDIAGLNRILLLNAGVKPENIADADICTVCHPEIFHSFRRDKVKGQNMVSGVAITAGDVKTNAGPNRY